MDTTALLAGVTFWLSFAFSPGPFWAAWMNYHTQDNSLKVYKVYIPYLLLVFCVQCFALACVVQYFGQLNPNLFIALYFIGGGFIIYYAITSFKASIAKKSVVFGFKEMAILGLSNPKIYLTVPTGALTANYFPDSVVLNGFIFAGLLSAPIMLCGSLFYALLSKVSTRLLVEKIKFFTTGLLLAYGLFLIYEGVLEVIEFLLN